MSLSIWILAPVLGLSSAALVLLLLRRRRAPRPNVSAVLDQRRAEIRGRLAEILDRTPARSPLASSEFPAHPRAARIEAKLLAGELTAALLMAEDVLLEEPSDARVYVLLARVLIYCDEFAAASRKIVRARRLGASGPMLDYLEARVQHSQLHRDTEGRTGERVRTSTSELITPFEEFVLELHRQRKRPRKARQLWLAVMRRSAGTPESELADIASLLAEHFSGYYDCLDKLILAVEREPAFTDALYHLARMALKAGFRDEGLALMEKIAPLMYASPEKRFYDRDISRLRAAAALPDPVVLPVRGPNRPSGHRSQRAGMLD